MKTHLLLFLCFICSTSLLAKQIMCSDTGEEWTIADFSLHSLKFTPQSHSTDWDINYEHLNYLSCRQTKTDTLSNDLELIINTCDDCIINQSFECDTTQPDLIFTLTNTSTIVNPCTYNYSEWFEWVDGSYNSLGIGDVIYPNLAVNATEICQVLHYLTETQEMCSDTLCKPICNNYICNPIVDFTGAINEGTIVFNNLSAIDDPCSIIDYAWTFGDGNNASIENPSHTYSNILPTSFEACLTLTWKHPECPEIFSKSVCKYLSIPGSGVSNSLGGIYEICDPVIDLGDDEILIDSIQASISVISSGTIENGSSVNFLAGSSIALNPGFEIKLGANLSASMNPCTDCNIPNSNDCNLADLYKPEVDSINASLIGFVYDDNGIPVENVSVQLGNGAITSTDTYGHFFFKDETMNSLGETVTLSPACCHVTILKRFYPVAGKQSRVHAQLTPQNFNQSFSSTTGGIIDNLGSSGSNGLAEVTLAMPENGIVDEAGNPYDGNVNAAVAYLDPTLYSSFDQMPGDLSAFNNEAQTGVLKSFGMMSVELVDDSGNELNLSPDHCASFEMKVAPDQISDAPSFIALWYFDESLGIWIEEGSAIFDPASASYKGYVCHFSWWNCDDFADDIQLSFTLEDALGNPMPQMQTTLSWISDPAIFGNAYTTDDGFVTGIVAEDEPLLLEVFDLCGNLVFDMVIPGLLTDTDLGTLTIATFEMLNILGSLEDCVGDLVENGVIITEVDGNVVYNYIETPGTNPFDLFIPKCTSSTSFDITGVDLDDFTMSPSSSFAIVPGPIAVGIITACDGLENFIEYTLDSDPQVLYINGAATVGANTEVEGSNISGSSFIQLIIPGTTVGVYPSTTINISDGINASATISAEITIYGVVGEQIIGSFNGSFMDFNFVPHTISGSFSVENP